MAPQKTKKWNHGLTQKSHFWEYTAKNRRQEHEQTRVWPRSPPNSRRSRCPRADEWTNRMWPVHTRSVIQPHKEGDSDSGYSTDEPRRLYSVKQASPQSRMTLPYESANVKHLEPSSSRRQTVEEWFAGVEKGESVQRFLARWESSGDRHGGWSHSSVNVLNVTGLYCKLVKVLPCMFCLFITVTSS